MITLDEKNYFNISSFYTEILEKIEDIDFSNVIDDFMLYVDDAKTEILLFDKAYTGILSEFADAVHKNTKDYDNFYDTSSIMNNGSFRYKTKIYYSTRTNDFTTIAEFNKTVLISDMSINLTYSSAQSGFGKQIMLYFFDLITEDDLRTFYRDSLLRKSKNRIKKSLNLNNQFSLDEIMNGKVLIRMLDSANLENAGIMINDLDDIAYFKQSIISGRVMANNSKIYEAGIKYNIPEFYPILRIAFNNTNSFLKLYSDIEKYSDKSIIDLLKHYYDNDFNYNQEFIINIEYLDKTFELNLSSIINTDYHLSNLIRELSRSFNLNDNSKLFEKLILEKWFLEMIDYLPNITIYDLFLYIKLENDYRDIRNAYSFLSVYNYIFENDNKMPDIIFYDIKELNNKESFTLEKFKESIFNKVNCKLTNRLNNPSIKVMLTMLNELDANNIDLIFDRMKLINI